TDDYLLLENGELLDADGDLAVMASPGSGYERTDLFDFRSVKIQGSVAYAVYFLTSDIKDKQGARLREWLESMILRRLGTAGRSAPVARARMKNAGGLGVPRPRQTHSRSAPAGRTVRSSSDA